MENVSKLSAEGSKFRIYFALSFAYVLAYVVFIQAISPSDERYVLYIDLLYDMPLILAFACTFFAFTRSEKHSRFWMLIAAALFAVALPEVLLTYYLDISTNFLDPAISTALTNLFFVFYAVFPIMVLSRLYLRIRNRYGRLSLLANLGIFFSTTVSIFYIIMISRSTVSDLNAELLPLAYSIFSFLLVDGLWTAAVKLTGRELKDWEKYLFIALGSLLVSDMFYLQSVSLNFSRHGSPFEAGWIIASFFIAAAALKDISAKVPADGTDKEFIEAPPLWKQVQSRATGPIVIGSANLFVLYYISKRPADLVTDTLSVYIALTILLIMFKYYILTKENQFLESNTIIDVLTNVYSKEYFLQDIELEVERAKRYKRNLALVLIDIDNYKRISSEYNYIRGERILSKVAAAINFHMRKSDSLSRIGEDEFALIMLEVPFKQTSEIAKRIKNTIVNDVADIFPEIKLTASIGVALYPDSAVDHKTLYGNAAKAVRAAKDAGKDRSCSFAPNGTISCEE